MKKKKNEEYKESQRITMSISGKLNFTQKHSSKR